MKMMLKILKMIIKTTKKNTSHQNKSIIIKIVQQCQKIIKNYNFKRIDKSLNIILNLLFTAIIIKIPKNLIINKMMNSKPKTIIKITRHLYSKRNIFLETKNNAYKIKKDKSSKTLLILENKTSIVLKKSKIIKDQKPNKLRKLMKPKMNKKSI